MGLGSGIQGEGMRVRGLVKKKRNIRFQVHGLRCEVQNSEVSVSGLGVRDRRVDSFGSLVQGLASLKFRSSLSELNGTWRSMSGRST